MVIPTPLGTPRHPRTPQSTPQRPSTPRADLRWEKADFWRTKGEGGWEKAERELVDFDLSPPTMDERMFHLHLHYLQGEGEKKMKSPVVVNPYLDCACRARLTATVRRLIQAI